MLSYVGEGATGISWAGAGMLLTTPRTALHGKDVFSSNVSRDELEKHRYKPMLQNMYVFELELYIP